LEGSGKLGLLGDLLEGRNQAGENFPLSTKAVRMVAGPLHLHWLKHSNGNSSSFEIS